MFLRLLFLGDKFIYFDYKDNFMCISNIPNWLNWLIVLFGPILLLVLNLILIKSKKSKETKRNLIIGSIAAGLLWAIYWIVSQFLSACI